MAKKDNGDKNPIKPDVKIKPMGTKTTFGVGGNTKDKDNDNKGGK